MRIATSGRDYRSSLSKGKKEVDDLRKSEILSDIFNHQPIDNSKNKKDARVQLSHASKALANELKNNVNFFLHENKELFHDLNQIELPEEFENDLGGDLSVRKLKVYLRWQEFHSEEKDVKGSNQLSFQKIQSYNKIDEIKKIYNDNDLKRESIKQLRSKHQPSYYYQVFPETYSFN